MATITFEARNLVSELLDNAAHDHNTLMMDIYGEIESEVWEAHITIIFNPLRFRRGSEGKIGDFWYGNTGANIVLDLKRSGVRKGNGCRYSNCRDGCRLKYTFRKGNMERWGYAWNRCFIWRSNGYRRWRSSSRYWSNRLGYLQCCHQIVIKIFNL